VVPPVVVLLPPVSEPPFVIPPVNEPPVAVPPDAEPPVGVLPPDGVPPVAVVPPAVVPPVAKVPPVATVPPRAVRPPDAVVATVLPPDRLPPPLPPLAALLCVAGSPPCAECDGGAKAHAPSNASTARIGAGGNFMNALLCFGLQNPARPGIGNRDRVPGGPKAMQETPLRQVPRPCSHQNSGSLASPEPTIGCVAAGPRRHTRRVRRSFPFQGPVEVSSPPTRLFIFLVLRPAGRETRTAV